MATQRLSRLHKHILQWLAADHQRTKGFILSSHEELVKALQRDKGTISRSLLDWQSSIDRLIQVDSPSRNSPWFEEKESPYGQISCHPYG